MKYKRRQVDVIDAVQWFKSGDNPMIKGLHVDPLFGSFGPHAGCKKTDQEHGQIDAVGARHIVCPGDWIVIDSRGRIASHSPEMFEKLYEIDDDDDYEFVEDFYEDL